MKYEIEVKETISRINTYTVEVSSEEEGESLLNVIEEDIEGAIHPDDITYAIDNAGYEIIEFCEGSEDVEYELY